MIDILDVATVSIYEVLRYAHAPPSLGHARGELYIGVVKLGFIQLLKPSVKPACQVGYLLAR